MAATGSDLLLGLDIGTSRTKAVLVDAAGELVPTGEVAARTPFVARDGRVEMTVEALLHTVRELLAGIGDLRRRVAAVGVAGMAESGAPLDAAGRALAPVIAWHDSRGRESVAMMERELSPGLPGRIGQPVRTVLTVAKLGWLLDQGLQGFVRWLGVPELALHALTGAEAVECSLAARTGCYDVTAGAWIPEVADLLGFSVDVFAPVLAAGEAMGRISADGGAWSGLPPGIPVAVAGHDHLAGMAGAGVRRGELANSVGTAETLVARSEVLPDIGTALARRVAVTVYPGGGEWAALAGAARAGLVLESAAAALGRSPEDLDGLAADAEPVDVGDAVGLLAAGEPATLPAVAPGRVWAGLLQTLTARTADAYDRLAAVAGPGQRMVVFGGGAASAPWLRMKSAALPLPVVSSAVTAAPASGAAIQAGVAAGWWPSADEAPVPRPPRAS